VGGGFTLDQVWQQITHHTEKANKALLRELNKLVADSDFVEDLDRVSEEIQELDSQVE